MNMHNISSLLLIPQCTLCVIFRDSIFFYITLLIIGIHFSDSISVLAFLSMTAISGKTNCIVNFFSSTIVITGFTRSGFSAMYKKLIKLVYFL